VAVTADEPTTFASVEDSDNPGWLTWQLSDTSRFNDVLGKLIVRLDGDIARVRMFPERVHTNMNDNIHGGVTLTFADVALFAGARLLGMTSTDSAVTLDLNMQFIRAGKAGEPLDADVELLRETGRLVFLRGIVFQGHGKVSAFSGTLRKATVGK
jgi:uncharacterized protein (TIGR00369 family)